ncbi:phytanoyl-CoA dioxygenase family protein [Noviherbaspirillum sp.]|uniref:phytanoyl-CoA dioxygenase family protein n=1 Tax=Noviherbaspirillum sp. TaxID=1926288 RepID=UPI002FE2EEE0
MEFAQLTPGPGFAPVQSLLYYGQRLVTSPPLRRAIVSSLQAGVRLRQGSSGADMALTSQESQTLQTLTRDGYAPFPSLFSPEQVADIHAFLRPKLLAARRSNITPFTIDQVPDGVRIADYAMKDIIDSPHILALANSPSLLRIASSYIGCKPTISALGLRWSFPSMATGTDVQAFHRDSDDWRYMKILVYLTDVDDQAGPHMFVKGTHTARLSARLQHYKDADIQEKYGSERTMIATGKAGFGFAVDTSGIHKGQVPVRDARLMLQIQYSILPAYAYRYEPQSYKGRLKLDPYINRLFCK